LQDDLLDLTADQAKLGKTVGLDIVEGKKTWMIIRANHILGNGISKNPEYNDLMDEFYKNNGLPLERTTEMRDMLEKLGVLNEASELIDDYFRKADKHISTLKNNDYSLMLKWLITLLSDRNY